MFFYRRFAYPAAALAMVQASPSLAETSALAPCPLPQAPAGSTTVEALAQQSRELLAAGDFARAEGLLEGLLPAANDDITRAWALRMLVDLRLGRGDLDELERILESDCIRGEARVHALAWLAYRQGRYADAAALLQPLARPRHHTLPRWSIVHEDLGDAYARVGQRADAQAQWRIALATDHDPGAGWDRAALERKLAAELNAPGGTEPMLPLQRYDDAISILDLASVEGTETGVRYDKLVLLKQDENGVALGIDTWEVDCNEPRARVLAVHSFNADGEIVKVVDEPAAWARDLPGEPWRATERRLVCAVEPSTRPAPRSRTNVEMLRAYRAGEPVFEDTARDMSGYSSASAVGVALGAQDGRTLECIAQVEAFIAGVSSDGPVAGPTWQVRDWWDERSWDIDEAVRERELNAARDHATELARRDPSAAKATQVACLQEAVDGGALSGL